MPIFRLILAVIIIWLVVSFYKRIQKKIKASLPAKAQAIKQQSPEEIIPCELCGLHVPRADSVKSNDLFFCSSAHAREYHHH